MDIIPRTGTDEDRAAWWYCFQLGGPFDIYWTYEKMSKWGF